MYKALLWEMGTAKGIANLKRLLGIEIHIRLK